MTKRYNLKPLLATNLDPTVTTWTELFGAFLDFRTSLKTNSGTREKQIAKENAKKKNEETVAENDVSAVAWEITADAPCRNRRA